MQFPETIFVKSMTIDDQCLHVVSEAIEAAREDDPFKKAMELYDTIHSSETGLQILEDQFGVDLDHAKQEVIEKNRKRGYYP